MVPDFKIALLAAGIFLLLVGVASELGYLSAVIGSPDMLGRISEGFTTTAYTFFSGVLIGVGIALLTDSALLGLKRHTARLVFLSLLSVTTLCIAYVSFSVNTGEGQLLYLIIMFASISAFISYTLSILVTFACVLGGRLCDEIPAPEKTAHKKGVGK